MEPMDAHLQKLLRRAWETGRRQWPQVDLTAEIFMRHLFQVLPQARAASSFEPLFEKLDLQGLYLAGACLNDVPHAMSMLEQHYMAQIPALLGPKLSKATVDEVCQMVRTQLLVGASAGGPRLASFKGLGSLMSWIQVIAVRMAVRLGNSDRETPDQSALGVIEAFPSPDMDPELALIKSRYRHEFNQALREAFAVLPKEERYLLWLHFFKGLPTTKMGPLFKKDQSTISRWLKEAREKVYEETKRRLKDRLRLTTQEFESLMDAIKSRLDMSLSQILKEDDGREEKEPDKKEEEGKNKEGKEH
ncbi:MAG TPA: sigma-70 family RNA polymerase sigma factor [Hyalangium sp.]|nr:sigma-70 family RNA polymerase sigma factor [Hyalangium sp.]